MFCTICLAIMNPKHDPRRLNTNNGLNPEVVNWYVIFLVALGMKMIYIWVGLQTIGNILLRRTIVKMTYTIILSMVYPKYDPMS